VISVVQLGTIDYPTGLRLQEQLVALRKEGRIADVLLLLEHTPVITLGRNAKAGHILASPDCLEQRGVEVFECNRGGDVTFHGPGQLVAYPIFDLRGFPSKSGNRRTMGVIELVRALEEVLIRTCAEFGVSTKRIEGLTGVWTAEATAATVADPSTAPDGRGLQPLPGLAIEPTSGGRPEAKIAALGLHISRGVTSHGMALNVNTDLTFFDLIVPCGISSRPVTSLAREIGRPLPPPQVAQVLARNCGTVLGSRMRWFDSLEAVLGTAVGVPLKIPDDLRRLRGEDDPAWT
jgi:lipoyl(octanoyl) transferase